MTISHKDSENVVYEDVAAGFLEVRDDGTIWRVRLRPRGPAAGLGRVDVPNMKGYLRVRVTRNSESYWAMAHRIVYRHFHGALPRTLTINHKNGVRTDNRPDNLEACMLSANLLHAFDTGLIHRGERHHAAKLTDDAVRQIRALHAAGRNDQTTIGRKFGVRRQTVSLIVTGKAWTHVKGGA